MREIRTIRKNEATVFLKLLCNVFKLDYKRAKNAFFSEPFYELDRKWAYFENSKIIACLTTVPLLFGDGQATGIAGVATTPERRGGGVATALLKEVLKRGKENDEERALLFATKENLYKKAGFSSLDRVVTQVLAPGNIDLERKKMKQTELKRIYGAWAAENPRRLQRDDRRWRFWNWNKKTVYVQPGGYTCYEFGRVREMLPDFLPLPITDRAEWYGLFSMGERLGVPLNDPRQEMILMGYDFDYVPEMFLSDQF